MSFVGNKEIAAALLGDGNDGVGNVSTSISLSRNMYYTSLTVTGAGTIAMNGFKIFSRSFVRCDGVIHCDGVSAAASFPGIGVTASTGIGGSGGAGNAGAGSAGSNGGISMDKCARGGSGGAGSGGAGGSSPPRTAVSGVFGGPNPAIISFGAVLAMYLQSTGKYVGGSGGGGGGGNGANSGGGGGQGGGLVHIYAMSVYGSGSIRANGGNGAAGTAANCGGGGGGGAGSVVIVSSNDVSTTSLNLTSSGGSGGASGGGAGVAGSAGSNGTGYTNSRFAL